MSSRFDGIMLRGLDRLIPVGQEDVLGLEVATVTSEKGERPITVHKLSDPVGVDIQILTYWIDPDPGQRVWLMKTKTQRIIVGVHGGKLPALGDLMVPTVIPTGADLNNYTTPGLFHQPDTAAAATGTNYPEALAGLLEVFRSTTAGYMTWQRYTTYVASGIPPRVWSRNYYNGTWSPWSCLNPQQVRAKMTKTDRGPTYSANTWTKVTGFGSSDYNLGLGTNTAAGEISVSAYSAGYFDLTFHARWQSYGSVYDRSAAIVLGTSAPATDASNVLGQDTYTQSGWLIHTVVANDVYLNAGDVISFWVRSAVGSTFNAANTAMPGWTYVAARRAG